MAPRDPETDPRALLGKMLKRARIRAGFKSQEALAAALGFDRSVVTKAETGDRPPSADVLTAWCRACALDEEVYAELAVLARRADGPVPTWFEDWLRAEGAATSLRLWSPILVPGLLQTAEYARAVFQVAYDDEDEISDQVAVRMDRQAILDRPDPPLVVAVLDESVLYRQIGTPAVMADQLEHVAAMAQRLAISVHILPATGANVGLSGAFDLASSDSGTVTLRMENVEDQTMENRELVRKAEVNFDLVRRDALPRVPSRSTILEAAEKWKTRS